MSLRILQLSKKYPFPQRDGESIAINYLSKALSDLGCEVSLLAMNTTKHFQVKPKFGTHNNTHYQEIRTVVVDNKIKIWDAFLNLFSSKSYHINRFISQEFETELIKLLEASEYDIIQLETLYLTPYIPIIKKYSGAKICMRAHNIEFEIWERISNNTSSFIRRKYLNYLTGKLKEYEIEHLNDYDFLVSVSNRDLTKLKKLGYKNGAISSPIGLNINKYKVKKEINSKNEICFIGSLDWIPNQEGLMWFINKVWPMLLSRNPDLKFHIAGRNIGPEILALQSENILIHGEVTDAIKFISDYDMMVVPLLSGSGTRVKILEGMLLGKTIVTTSLGMEGIEIVDGKHIVVADSPMEFVESIEKFLWDEFKKSELGKNAQEYIKEHYNHLVHARKLVSSYQKIISSDYSQV